MNDTYIVTTYVVIDDILKAWNFEDDCRATGHAAETLTVAVLAAKYFQNPHERALSVLIRLGYVSRLSVSRFNRQLHKLRDWLYGMVCLVGELFSQGEAFIIDSLPLPVCKRVRARRCRKVRGGEFCGYCAAKDEKFFGWRSPANSLPSITTLLYTSTFASRCNCLLRERCVRLDLINGAFPVAFLGIVTTCCTVM